MRQDLQEKYLVVKDQRVVKSNDLIQKSRFDLSLQEQKIILYLISQITPYDEEFKNYEFSIPEFCKICGIDHTSGGNYADLKPRLNKRSGTIKIRLDEDMKPFLLQLKQNFTAYELIYTLRFRSKYSTRLFELVSSIHYRTLEAYSREYTIDELRRLMGAENYKTWQSFKERALIPAVNEINQYSDKNLTYEVIKRGRSVAGVKLTVSSKDSLEACRIRSQIEKDLGYDQITLWDVLEDSGLV